MKDDSPPGYSSSWISFMILVAMSNLARRVLGVAGVLREYTHSTWPPPPLLLPF